MSKPSTAKKPGTVTVLKPAEWIACDCVAVRTASILVAADVAAFVRKHVQVSRQSGRRYVRGVIVEWMCLALFNERLEKQRAATGAK
jgi:hypothetical protein